MADDIQNPTRAAYDKVASSYAAMLPDTRYEAPVDVAMVRHFVETIAPRPAAVLDAGCGSGRMISYLMTLDSDLVMSGSDLSPGMLEEAASAHPGVELVVADNAALPFEDGRFDGILSWYSVIHTPPDGLTDVFAEFHRVLRPAGALLLGYQSGVGRRRVERPYGHDVELTAFLHHTPYVASALRSTGFETVAVLDREPRVSEKHSQGFVIATRF